MTKLHHVDDEICHLMTISRFFDVNLIGKLDFNYGLILGAETAVASLFGLIYDSVCLPWCRAEL